MDSDAVRGAFETRLDTLSPGYSFVWPNVNRPAAAAYPFVEISFQIVETTGGTLKGNEIKREIGIFSASVVIERGVGEKVGLDIADDIKALFPEGHTMNVSGGRVRITQPAGIRSGYPDEASWRIPVIARYDAVSD